MIENPGFEGKTGISSCTFCEELLDESRRAYCTDCRAPHHEDCYRWIRHCAAPHCRGLRFDHGCRVHVPMEVIDFPQTPPDRIAGRPELLERAVRIARARDCRSTRRIMLELDSDHAGRTRLRDLARYLGSWLLVAMIGAQALPVELLVPWVTACAMIGVLDVLRHLPGGDRYFVFDGPTRSVMFHVRQPGKPVLSTVGPFEDIDRIRIRCREGEAAADYSLELDLKDGRRLDLSGSMPEDTHGCPEDLRERAELLAGLTGVPVESRRLA